MKSTAFIIFVESPPEEPPLLRGILKSGEQHGPASPLVDTYDELDASSDFSNLETLLLLLSSRTDTNYWASFSTIDSYISPSEQSFFFLETESFS